MADELPQQGGEKEQQAPPVTEEKPPETVEKPVVETGGSQEEIDESKEPGGDSPQDVYRRKLFRQAKQSREEAQREREARIAAEARAKALEEQASKPPVKPKPTVQDVQAAMDAGTVSVSEGTSYIAQLKAEEIVDQRERARQQNEAALRPIQKAARDIQAYVQAAPWLADDTDDRTLGIGAKYQQLVNEFGYAPNLATKRVAIEMALGPVDKLRTQREVSNLTGRSTGTHALPPGGGGQNLGESGNVVSKVPKEMVDGWKAMGASDEQIKSYAQHHLNKMAARRARFGG